jgi:predicted transcriptional regulator
LIARSANVRIHTHRVSQRAIQCARFTRAEGAANALSDYLDWRIPQIENLKLAIAAADRGEFASDEEVEATFKKYGA